jgi:hypothetical protein
MSWWELNCNLVDVNSHIWKYLQIRNRILWSYLKEKENVFYTIVEAFTANKYTNILSSKDQRVGDHFRLHQQSWCTEWPHEASHSQTDVRCIYITHILATYGHSSLQPRLIYIRYVWTFITWTLTMEKVSGTFHFSLTMTRMIAGGNFSAQFCST